MIIKILSFLCSTANPKSDPVPHTHPTYHRKGKQEEMLEYRINIIEKLQEAGVNTTIAKKKQASSDSQWSTTHHLKVVGL